MFDDLLRLYPIKKRESTKDPKSCTDICRRLFLSAWTARLRIAEAQVIRKQYQMSIGATTTNFHAVTWLNGSWTLPWQEREFGSLVRAKSALESIDADLSYNIDALGNNSCVDDWEAAAWKGLRDAVGSLKKRVDIISQAYSQAVSVRESIVANRQAQQVGYLTSLATLFIPASLLAGIFSMGGDFSAGASRFWVFWVISVPLVLMSCIFLFTKLGGWILSLLRRCSGQVNVEKSFV